MGTHTSIGFVLTAMLERFDLLPEVERSKPLYEQVLNAACRDGKLEIVTALHEHIGNFLGQPHYVVCC